MYFQVTIVVNFVLFNGGIPSTILHTLIYVLQKFSEILSLTLPSVVGGCNNTDFMFMGPFVELLLILYIVWLEPDPDDPVAERPIIAVELL